MAKSRGFLGNNARFNSHRLTSLHISFITLHYIISRHIRSRKITSRHTSLQITYTNLTSHPSSCWEWQKSKSQNLPKMSVPDLSDLIWCRSEEQTRDLTYFQNYISAVWSRSIRWSDLSIQILWFWHLIYLSTNFCVTSSDPSQTCFDLVWTSPNKIRPSSY